MKPFFLCSPTLFGSVVLLLGAHAVADDLALAPFRGDPNSVMAKFNLQGQPSLDLFAEGANPTYPLASILPDITPDFSGDPLYQVELPNYIDDLPLKLMRIQYSWFGQAGDATTVTINVSPNVGGSIGLVDSGPVTPVPGVANAFHRWDDFEIRPNPDFESIQVQFTNADPRWLIFDTISTVPEPSGFAFGLLLILGVASGRQNG